VYAPGAARATRAVGDLAPPARMPTDAGGVRSRFAIAGRCSGTASSASTPSGRGSRSSTHTPDWQSEFWVHGFQLVMLAHARLWPDGRHDTTLPPLHPQAPDPQSPSNQHSPPAGCAQLAEYVELGKHALLAVSPGQPHRPDAHCEADEQESNAAPRHVCELPAATHAPHAHEPLPHAAS
jgi:hypothetical protein